MVIGIQLKQPIFIMTKEVGDIACVKHVETSGLRVVKKKPVEEIYTEQIQSLELL